jgi:hypothetical protein
MLDNVKIIWRKRGSSPPTFFQVGREDLVSYRILDAGGREEG